MFFSSGLLKLRSWMRAVIRLSMVSPLLALGLAYSGTTTADDKSVILILGDSISAAYNMEQAESWPALLSARLEQDGYAYRVFNSSITGDTTEGGLSRLPRLLASQQPAVVVIELGGNDGLRGLSLDVTRKNLEQMLKLSQQAGARVVLAGIQLPPNYGPTYTERFANMYVELADENDAALIPFILQDIALNPSLMQDDGIHPNVQAQPVLLDLVWTALQPLLEKSGDKNREEKNQQSRQRPHAVGQPGLVGDDLGRAGLV